MRKGSFMLFCKIAAQTRRAHAEEFATFYLPESCLNLCKKKQNKKNPHQQKNLRLSQVEDQSFWAA